MVKTALRLVFVVAVGMGMMWLIADSLDMDIDHRNEIIENHIEETTSR